MTRPSFGRTDQHDGATEVMEKTKRFPDAKRRAETDEQLLARVDRTRDKLVKDGGPTSADLVRAIRILLARKEEGRGR